MRYDYTRWEPMIRKAYANRSIGALKIISNESGIPVGSLKYHALSVLRLQRMVAVDRHNKPWEEKEIDIIENHGEKSLRAIRVRLKKAGFCRSPCAIETKLSLLRIRATRTDYITLADFSARMGYDPKSADRWVKRGLIKTKKQVMTSRSSGIGFRYISRNEIKNFLIDHPAAYDHRRIDWNWALDILTGKEIGKGAIADSCGSGYVTDYSVAD